MENTHYIKMENLKNGYCYKILARNAYVGVWISQMKAFMISRYKMGDYPFLFYEYHWDTNDAIHFPYGTAKPMAIIEKFPFKIKDDYTDEESKQISHYLDELEESNPITPGINTLQQRKQAAINWEKRLEAKRCLARELEQQGISCRLRKTV